MHLKLLQNLFGSQIDMNTVIWRKPWENQYQIEHDLSQMIIVTSNKINVVVF